MSKKTLWVVTGAIGIVGLGAGVASAAGGVSGENSFEESPAVEVSNLDSSPSALPSASPSASPSPVVIDLTTTPPSALPDDGTAAVSPMSVNTTVSPVTTVSTVSPASPVSVQSPISPPSAQSPVSAQSSS